MSLKLTMIATLALGLLAFAACSDDDDNGGTNPPPPQTTWIGTWLSAGDDVAPLLVTLFNYDSVRVTMNENNTVVLETHPAGGAWSSISGVYAVDTKAGGIRSISISYPTFEQEGIIEVFAASPDSMWLEVVQTVPDIGATPPTVADGFGANPALGTTNIQRYRRVDQDPWVGTWLSAGDDVAPLLVTLFDYDSVRVTMNENNTVVLETHPKDGAWATVNGVYSVTESTTGEVHSIAINYPTFEQEGIVQVFSGSPEALWLEVVQVVPDIGATPPTPADGFGANPALGTTNIQKYRRTSY
jgi:hypothetical protein